MKQVSSLRVGKGFKKTEIGELPADWEVAELIEVCEKPEYGYTSRSVTKPFGPKLLRIPDIQSGNVNWNSVPFCDCPADIRERYRLRDGDIVFARTGASTGKSFLLQKCPDAIFASYLIKVTGTKIEPLFLYMYFNSYSYWKQIQQLTVGSAQGGLNANKLSHLKVPFPPIAEQRKIGEILSIVDDAFRKLSGIIEKMKLLKKGIMRRLLAQGIGHAKFKTTRIGKMPAAWEHKDLSSLATRITKGTTPPTYGYPYSKDGVLFLRIENINDNGSFNLQNAKHISMQTHDSLGRSRLKSGDILISIAGASGRVSMVTDAILPANINQALALVRISERNVDQKYLFYALQGKAVGKQVAFLSSQLAQANLSLTQVGTLTIPLPPLTEQSQIALILSSIDEDREQTLKYQAKLGELKNALRRVLLTGKVRVKV
jgi:type I restriction enzyme S subunit